MIFTLFVFVNFISFLIRPEWAALMAMPTTFALYHKGLVNGYFTGLIFLVCTVAVASYNMDSFFVLFVHDLFYSTILLKNYQSGKNEN